jgi:hypothetical protein
VCDKNLKGAEKPIKAQFVYISECLYRLKAGLFVRSAAWERRVRPERGCAASQPQPRSQFHEPEPLGRVFWLATSLRLVSDTAALRQIGSARPLCANASCGQSRRILSHTLSPPVVAANSGGYWRIVNLLAPDTQNEAAF